MTRAEAARVVVKLAGDAPIVASLGHPAYDLYAVGDRPRNFYTWGSMGLASSIGLGLALAQPALQVIVIDGDGSLLMNLGSLATIGLTRPSNLVLVVMDNGEYGTTGGQKTPTSSGADLAAAGRAMGLSSAVTVRTEAELTAAIAPGRPGGTPGGEHADARREPSIVIVKVDESSPEARPPLDCVFLKQRFMAAIGAAEGAASGSTR